MVGSRAGLLLFVQLLRDYVTDSRNRKISEHEHYGPYMYLEVMTWTKPGMAGHAIHGSLEDFGRLAGLVERALAGLEPGGVTRVREEYAGDSEYALVIDRRADGFDPAAADPGLREAGEERLPG